jgi:hypothetical protein
VAEKAQLEVTIGVDGEVQIVTHGLTGDACLEETRQLEKALGKVVKREKTRDFYKGREKGRTFVRGR